MLLSLLISVVGDTYDKARLTQEAELFKHRARICTVCHRWDLEEFLRCAYNFDPGRLRKLWLSINVALGCLAILLPIIITTFFGDLEIGQSKPGRRILIACEVALIVWTLMYLFANRIRYLHERWDKYESILLCILH